MQYYIVMEDLKLTVGKNLSALRKKHKLTQIELAEKFNYSDKAVSKWEQGSTLPDLDTLKQLCDFYGVTIDYLTQPENIKNPHYDMNKEKFLLANHITMTCLLSSIMLIIAVIIFVYPFVFLHSNQAYWPIFIWTVAATALVIFFCNLRWFKSKIANFVVWTLFAWSLLVATHMHLLFFTSGYYNVWMIYLIGIPVQSTLVLWLILRLRK